MECHDERRIVCLILNNIRGRDSSFRLQRERISWLDEDVCACILIGVLSNTNYAVDYWAGILVVCLGECGNVAGNDTNVG